MMMMMMMTTTTMMRRRRNDEWEKWRRTMVWERGGTGRKRGRVNSKD